MTILLIIISLLLMFSALITGVVHLLFLYETINSNGLEWFREQTDKSPLLLFLKGLAQAFWAQLIVGVTYILACVPRMWFPVKPCTPHPPPILLVHGLYHNASAWLIFRRRLKKAGFSNVYAFSYSSWGTDFIYAAAMLEKRVNKVLRQCPEQGLLLVGHSLGGLLVRHYMNIGNRRKEVVGAVTLGAPHHGSKLAALGLGRLARSLLYRGALIKRIEAEDVPPDVPCLSLFSTMDEFVTPPQALRIALPGWQERHLPPMGHVSMLFNPQAARETVCFFRETLDQSPK